MNDQPKLLEPGHVEEPRLVEEYADVLSRVAESHQPVIVRRNGADLAAVVSLEHLHLLLDALAMQEAEAIAMKIDWSVVRQRQTIPQDYFDRDEPKPF